MLLPAITLAALSAGIPASAASVTAARSGARTSAVAASGYTNGTPTQIILDNGGYKHCLNDYQRNTNAGAPVDLYTCSSDPASKWLLEQGNQIASYYDPSLYLTVGSNGKIVLEPLNSGGTAAAHDWYIRADGALVSGTSVGGSTSELLNDPGYATTNGTQLIVYNQPAATSNAHFYIPTAHYATSRLPDRLDANPSADGPLGPTWADDTGVTRYSMVLYEGDAPGSYPHAYEASIYDTGSFQTIPGDDTPNQFEPDTGETLGTALSGTMTGNAWYYYNSDQWVTRAPAASYSGTVTSTPDWYQLFYPSGTNFEGGTIGMNEPTSFAWYWTYVTGQDACGNVETWVRGVFDNNGESATAGNITAPASCAS